MAESIGTTFGTGFDTVLRLLAACDGCELAYNDRALEPGEGWLVVVAGSDE